MISALNASGPAARPAASAKSLSAQDTLSKHHGTSSRPQCVNIITESQCSINLAELVHFCDSRVQLSNAMTGCLIRLAEQIKQHLTRLGESGPGKSVLRARRTRVPEMSKIPKSNKSNGHNQNVGKAKYIRKRRLKNENHAMLGQNHKDFIFL